MDNPLRQYFRRPALYLKLPSGGKFYHDHAIDLPENKEIPIYPMTAIDEITSRTPDALYNGSAVVEIIKSCVPNIKDPWDVPSIDIDTLLLGIRIATQGNEMEIESVCPKCDTHGTYSMNLVGLLGGMSQVNYDQPSQLGELVFTFQPISYRKANDMNLAQFELSKIINDLENTTDEQEKLTKSALTVKRLNELTITLIAESIQSVQTPDVVVTEKDHIVDFLKNCDKSTFDQLKNQTISMKEKTQLKPLKVVCGNCSHTYEQSLTINVTDFFG